MRVLLCLLLVAASQADESEDRRSKLPYIADAVGNTLPPPSGGPATVGSPVNLITPDRYEFYTFDESGELVKRLMTLEEIQAIVAAGEETEGLVTFANENQPTIAFNFSQPPYTKVHSVVTNVQNVLKAQMEAHKNKPQIQPTLDTPDVSDSWSLILPSIFGNTGVDIVPDKTSGKFTTPETETIEIDIPDDNSLSKESSNSILSSSTTAKEEVQINSVTQKLISTTEKVKTEATTTTTTTTSTTTTHKPSSTTTTTTTTTSKPITAKNTPKPVSTTTEKPLPTASKPTANKHTSTSIKPISTSRTTITTTTKPTTVRFRTTTTNRPKTTTTSKTRATTSVKPTTKIIKTTPKYTTSKPLQTTKKTTTTLKDDSNYTKIQTQTQSVALSTLEESTVKYEKISTFIPLSTAAFVTERTTQKIVPTVKIPARSTTKKIVQTTMTTKSPLTTIKTTPVGNNSLISTSSSNAPVSTTANNEVEKYNASTVTTQSVSPSTTASTTEFVSIGHHVHTTEKKPIANNDLRQNETDLHLFDVAQSFSQIASDLGGNFGPLPTSGDLLDTTKLNDINLESKENSEIDIPIDSENVTEKLEPESLNIDKIDNFIKIPTINPQNQNETKSLLTNNSSQEAMVQITKNEILSTTPAASITTTIDPILSESMDDLLSQIVNQAPPSILSTEKQPNEEIKVTSTPTSVSTNKETIDKTPVLPTSTPPVIQTTSSVQQLAYKNFTNENKNESNDIPTIIIDSRISDSESTEPNLKENLTERDSIKTEQNIACEKCKNATETNNQIEEKVRVSNKNDFGTVQNETLKNQGETLELLTSSTAIPTTTRSIVSKETRPPQKIFATEKTPTAKYSTKSPIINQKLPENTSNNKIVSSDNSKLTAFIEKDKIIEQLPKVDDFKKKIQKVNIDDKELVNDRNNSWKLISTVTPPKANEIPKDKLKNDVQDGNNKNILLEFSKENQGLEVTTKDLSEDVSQFTELCNELAFRYWHAMTETIDKRRSFVLSPYSVTSMLAMMFMGARGATSGEMNEILKLDDMVTFNPHFTLKNISDSIEINPSAGVIVSAFIRELFSDRSKGKILTFYKERAQHFYNGHVEEINFKLISDIIRRRTNLLVKRYTWGRIVEYMKANTISMQPPLAAFSANIFHTDCSGSSIEGRDGEMYFVVSPNVRQRRLVPVPAVVYRNGFLAGYDPVLDATAAALGNTNSKISTLFLMPGQQGNVVHAEDLEALEKRLLDSNPTTPAWNRLLRTLLPRMGLELQIPRFSHKSIFNVSTTLKKMGLKELFDPQQADLGGLNGPSKDLYLSDMVQSTSFVTCGEGVVGEQHHIEEYPDNLPGPQRRRTSRWVAGWDEPRDYQRAFHDPHDVGDAMNLPLHLRPRQARLPARNAQPARLKFDRPFLYFVRHNPSGMILYVGRFNPRLLP